MSVLVSISPNVCFSTTWGKKPNTIRVKMNEKTSINSIYPNL